MFYATAEIRPIRVLEMNLISDVKEARTKTDFLQKFLTQNG